MITHKLVSCKVAVLDALKNMGIEGSKEIPTITRWVLLAENKIGSRFGLKKKIVTLTVNHRCAELPCETSSVQGVILGNYGSDCFDLFDGCYGAAINIAASTTDTFLVIDKPDPNTRFQLGGIKYEIQDNNIVLSSQAYHGKQLTVQILAAELDLEGFPKILEKHVEACADYVMWRFAKRSRFSPNKMDHTDVDRLKRDWNESVLEARADDTQLSEDERAEIVAMINNPWSGYGNEIYSD